MIFQRNTLSLNFESDRLRLLISNGGEIKSWDQRELPAGLLEGGSVQRVESLGEYLSDLFSEAELPKGRIMAAVSAHRSIFRTLTLPPIEDSLLRDAIRRKLRQDIPMPGQELDLSYDVISRDESGVRVFVVATPRAVIDRHIQAFRAAGLRLRVMDASPLTLVRSANLARTIVGNMETSSLTVVIVDEGLPAVVRTVPLGAQVSSPDARLDLFVQEVERTTKYFNQSHKENPILPSSSLIVSGSYFAQPEYRDQLSGRTGYQVGLPEPPLALPEDFPVAEFSVNLGLALKRV